MIVADAVAGPIIALFGFAVGLVILVLIIPVEAVVLTLFKLMPFGAALRGSGAANAVSAAVGLALLVGGSFLDITELGWVWVVIWALSVGIEGVVLALLYPQLSRRIWVPTIVMNIISYALVIALVFVMINTR